MSDEYRSSDDEDYNPETEENLEENEVDDEEIPEINPEEEVEEYVEPEEEKSKSGAASSDIDALFAELTGEDPILAEINRRKKLEDVKPSTSLKFDAEKYGSKGDGNKDGDEEDEVEKVENEKEKTGKKRVGMLDAIQSLSKRSKMSVLSKSEKDWKDFTETAKISEDLSSHNRGKGGYLNRMDFLNRTDNRQFENEKEMRASARKDKI
ncbi:unnamed protein product [Caenorhabditis angaria]|uniref:Craniofacial development protein 1 n=1 Tax=Caenorhabditis angaria TaxID=860376 RepID=A0A9P1I1S3_9PELO|nr:unnamed protein product [Caenorhabditis angaria]